VISQTGCNFAKRRRKTSGLIFNIHGPLSSALYIIPIAVKRRRFKCTNTCSSRKPRNTHGGFVSKTLNIPESTEITLQHIIVTYTHVAG
jgi:hypothetical protein